MKQPSHAKIEFLSEVKSEIFVVEGLRGKFDKSDLTFDGETSTRVVESADVSNPLYAIADRLRPLAVLCLAGEPSEDTHGARKCVEIIAIGIAQCQQSRKIENHI